MPGHTKKTGETPRWTFPKAKLLTEQGARYPTFDEDRFPDVEVAQPPPDSISSLSFSPQSDHLAVGSWDNSVCSLALHDFDRLTWTYIGAHLRGRFEWPNYGKSDGFT